MTASASGAAAPAAPLDTEEAAETIPVAEGATCAGPAPLAPAACVPVVDKSWTMRKPSTEAELRLALAQIEAEGAQLPAGPAPRLVHARPDARMRLKLQPVSLERTPWP